MDTNSEERALLLGNEKISRLIWKFSLPAIAAMAASAAYNIIAGIFIGHLGAYAISGVGLTMPFMNLAAAFGSLVGVGSSVICSISLGEKDYTKARRALCNQIVLNVIMGLTFTAVGLAFLDPILIFFGATQNTLEPAREYMEIILYGNVFAHMFLGLNSILRVSGYPVAAMNLTFASVAVNLVLTPLFIYGFDMGVRGAALATVIAQLACCLAQFVLFTGKSRVVYIERDKFKPDFSIIKRSFAIGSPNFATNAAACFIVMLQNQILLEYGNDLYVGAMSIINRVVTLFFLIALGFSQGMQPIVAYNYGAKKYDRMWKAFKIAVICALVSCLAGFAITQLFASPITHLFVNGTSDLDIELIDITVGGFHTILACFWIIGTQIIGSNFFASMDQPVKSLFLSLTRQVIFIIPLLLILPPIFGVQGVWYTIPVSDIAAAVCTIILLLREHSRQKRIGWIS